MARPSLSRRTLALSAAAACVTGSAGLAALVPAGSAAASTSTIPGAAAQVISGAVDHGEATATTRSVTLGLAQRSTAALKQRIASHAAPLTSAQFLATYAPSAAEVSAVTSWAQAGGLTVGAVPANRAFVQVSGSQAAVEQALGVHFHSFTLSNGTPYVATVGTATLPSSVAADVTGILGLSSLDHVGLTPHATAAPAAGVSFPSSNAPSDLYAEYDAPSSATGSGQTLAIITEGDLSSPKADLVTFENTFGLSHVFWNQIQVGAPSTDTTGDDEWDLDSQWSTAFAPGVSTLDVYDGTSLANTDILATINRWVSDDAAKQGSFSAGECDLLAEVSGFPETLDPVLAQAAAQGQSLFVSTGDAGAYCQAVVGVNGVPAGIPDTEYPSTSPYALAVGGTTIVGPQTEVAWYAGGGGISPVEGPSDAQSSAGGTFTGVDRGVPDVSLDADPNSGYDVIVGGQEETIGGTSASAPSWQGIWARANGAASGALGFAAPVLYANSGAFTDIIAGTNGLYPASPGWDYTTGLGTPDIAKLVAAVS